MANELVELDIQFVTLCAAGANRRKFVAKGRDAAFELPLASRVLKLDDEQQIVYGVLYPIGEVDTQGDFITEAELDKAMHGFTARGRTAAGIAGDVNHDEQPTADYFPEVYKIAAGDTRYPENDWGAWAIARKVVDGDRWAQVKDGTFNAFSLGGTATVIKDSPVRKGKAVTAEHIAGLLKGRVAEMLADAELSHKIEALNLALFEALWEHGNDKEAAKAAIQALLREGIALTKQETPTMDKTTLATRITDFVVGLLKDDKADAPPIAPPVVDTAALDAVKADLAKANETNTALAAQVAQLTEAVEALKAQTPAGGTEHNTQPEGEALGFSFLGGYKKGA